MLYRMCWADVLSPPSEGGLFKQTLDAALIAADRAEPLQHCVLVAIGAGFQVGGESTLLSAFRGVYSRLRMNLAELWSRPQTWTTTTTILQRSQPSAMFSRAVRSLPGWTMYRRARLQLGWIRQDFRHRAASHSSLTEYWALLQVCAVLGGSWARMCDFSSEQCLQYS
jgi:hypothetical protein